MKVDRPYSKHVEWHFCPYNSDDTMYSLRHLHSNIWQLEHAAPSSHEDTHFSAVMIDGGKLDGEDITVVMTEEVCNAEYNDDDLPAIVRYVSQNGFPPRELP